MPIDAWWGSDGKKASEQVVKIEYSRLQQDVDAQLRQVCPDVNSITRSFDRALLALLREMTYSLDASGAPHRLLLLVNERPFTPWLPGFERMQREISQLAPYIPGLPEKGDPWRIIFKYESDDFAYEPIVNDENRAYWAGALH
jgi:hypothetical protein